MTLPPIKVSGVGTPLLYRRQVGLGLGIIDEQNANPPNVNAPIIFEPGPLFTGSRLVVCFILTGPRPTTSWGGCQLWGSVDGDSYGNMGFLVAGGVQGTLTATLPAAGDPDTSSTLMVNVLESAGVVPPGSNADADAGITLAYVDGELIGYSSSVKTAPGMYSLGSYLRRGMFGSTIGSHAPGSQFGLFNGNVWRQSYPSTMVGTTVYFKFASFNATGANIQHIADLEPYSYTLTGAGIGEQTGNMCAVDIGLAAGCSEDWGFLENVISSTCDWGVLGASPVTLTVDLGVLGV